MIYPLGRGILPLISLRSSAILKKENLTTLNASSDEFPPGQDEYSAEHDSHDDVAVNIKPRSHIVFAPHRDARQKDAS